MIENVVGCSTHSVGNQHLLGQADDKSAHTKGCFSGIYGALINFPGNILVANNGAGDQLGEERDVQQQFAIVFLQRHFPAGDINHIAQCLECEEGNADGQGNLGNGQIQTQDRIEVGKQEAGVLKDTQQTQIHNHSQYQEHLFLILVQKPGKSIVAQGAD